MSEEVLDSGTRNSILAAVAGLGKKGPQPIQESRTPGVQTNEISDLTSTAPKKWVETKVSEIKTTSAVTETETQVPNFCPNCGHKLVETTIKSKTKVDEGTLTSIAESKSVVKKQFDSSTPFNELLEACAESHTAAVEADTVASDEVRARVIRECNVEPSFLKDWRF